MSGVVRFQGQPFTPFITDTNRLGGVNRSVRLNIVPVCRSRTRCTQTIAQSEQAANPTSIRRLSRPPKGSLGNSPRTLDIRAPMQQFFDVSIQKSFNLPFIGDEGRRKINFRVDMINAFNHPTFRYNNTGNTPFGFGGLPSDALLTQADINAWNAANPGQTATLAQVNGILNSIRLPVAPGQTVGALPLDFFSPRIPEGFASRTANSFDIRTLEGLNFTVRDKRMIQTLVLCSRTTRRVIYSLA